MIYSSDIQIPVLCPIQFREPKEIDMYNRQTIYTPKILYNKNGYVIQILVSSDLYTASLSDKGGLKLIVKDTNNTVLSRYSFTIANLSVNYYYANSYFLLDNIEKCIYFEITDSSETIIYADSITYLFSPSYTGDIKTVLYTNNENDWNVIFSESITKVNIGLKRLDYLNWDYITFEYDSTTNKYIVKFKLETTHTLLGKVINVKIIAIDGGSNPSTTAVTIVAEETEYTVEILNETINNRIGYLIIEDDETKEIISSSSDYVFLTGFKRERTFYIDLECGFIPRDFRGEQETEDYLDQSLTNETIYGNHYEVNPLTIGDNGGIPNWLAYKIMCATLCDTFKIDDVEYKRVNGSGFEKVEDTENGLAIYKVDLQTENTYLQ